MKIAIITAMPEEFRAVAACFSSAGITLPGTVWASRFYTNEHEFVVVKSGMGLDNAARAVETLIQDNRPDLLVSTGFCGGITPGLCVSDIVVARMILIVNESGYEEIPVKLSDVGQTFVARQFAEGRRVICGVFVSTASITSKKHLAGMLWQYSNPVVEMESGAIAIIAAESNIPLLAIRVVSDTSAEDLGFSLDELCDVAMRRVIPYKVLQTVLRKPRILPQLVRLGFSSHRAAKSLTVALSRLFSTL